MPDLGGVVSRGLAVIFFQNQTTIGINLGKDAAPYASFEGKLHVSRGAPQIVDLRQKRTEPVFKGLQNEPAQVEQDSRGQLRQLGHRWKAFRQANRLVLQSGIRNLGMVAHINTDADDDALGDKLVEQQPGQLPVLNHDIVRPAHPNSLHAKLGKGLADGEPGDQRQAPGQSGPGA